MKEPIFPPMMTTLSETTEPYPRPDLVKCFHVQAGEPCTRYLEGTEGERAAIVAFLRRFEDPNAQYLANRIESGAHLKADQTGRSEP